MTFNDTLKANLATLKEAIAQALLKHGDVKACFDVWDDGEGNDPETSLCITHQPDVKLGDNYLALNIPELTDGGEATLRQWQTLLNSVTINAKNVIRWTDFDGGKHAN